MSDSRLEELRLRIEEREPKAEWLASSESVGPLSTGTCTSVNSRPYQLNYVTSLETKLAVLRRADRTAKRIPLLTSCVYVTGSLKCHVCSARRAELG